MVSNLHSEGEGRVEGDEWNWKKKSKLHTQSLTLPKTRLIINHWNQSRLVSGDLLLSLFPSCSFACNVSVAGSS